ncbi:hypothetical protein O181_068978 [Austropuccinia psidii MF-1]|uniref:Uncharacterized protein n=1 Tax=Austropuccinia psidii MF-1 TaxID=1389203 RepID=A0A9Q3EWA2_9BASI|nr:hypothetical protein [Austropuccinia psidii MF-1]
MSKIINKTAQIAKLLSLSPQRGFASSSLANKDFVQELYLRELKSYKPSPQTIQAMQNQVRDFTMPSAPPPPVLPSAPDLAQEFQAWDNASLVNNNVQAETSSQLESGGQTADEFLAFLERDHPAASSHH